MRQRQCPLLIGHDGEYAIGEIGRGVCHSTTRARRAESPISRRLSSSAESILLRLQVIPVCSGTASSAPSRSRIFFVSEALAGHRVMDIRCYLDARADAKRGIVTVAAMLLESGETLFFDPRNTFGVRIGNKHDFDEWARLNTEGNSDYHEFAWNRSS